MRQRRLNERVRTFIVQNLACFETPTAVAEAVHSVFGVKISASAAQYYDPTKSQGRVLASKWRLLFEATRKAFIEDCGTIAVSHRAVRLRKLQAEIELIEQRGQPMTVAHLLKQAAEEMGAIYTNRRELTGNSGGPIEVKQVSDRELAKAVAEILADGIDDAGD